MVDLQICKAKMRALQLLPSFSIAETTQAFRKLSKNYHPDFCTTSECQVENKAKIAQLAEAHSFWKNEENYKACKQIFGDHANRAAKGHLLLKNRFTGRS